MTVLGDADAGRVLEVCETRTLEATKALLSWGRFGLHGYVEWFHECHS